MQKLKFKPKVPPQKPRKSVPEKPNLEQSKPIDEELMKRLKVIDYSFHKLKT
jgi:DNA-directed RNA polymerase III subunit RPC4